MKLKKKKIPHHLCQKLCSSGNIHSHFLLLGRTQGGPLELADVRQVWLEKGQHSSCLLFCKAHRMFRARGQICVGTYYLG